MTSKATFAAGCFWGVEELFRVTPGVLSTRVGYCGGHLENPTYQAVCRGDTGHAEAVEITFDEQQISYQDLLNLFWKNHNPTLINQQGPDIGHQYRSVIFYHDAHQKKLAEQSRQALVESCKYSKPIATEIVAVTTFYEAEEYHQHYLLKNGGGHCQMGGAQ